MSGIGFPIDLNARPDHYLLDEVPSELEGLCEDTGSQGAGRWKAPAWAVELLEQAGWSRYSRGGTKKRNAILDRLKAAREDPDQAAYEDSLWRLAEPEQPRWYGVATGPRGYSGTMMPLQPTYYPSGGVSSAPSGPPQPAKKKP